MAYSSTPTPPPQSGFKVRAARRGDAVPVVTILGECGAVSDASTYAWVFGHPEMEMLVAADPWDKVIGFVIFSHRPILSLGGRAGTLDELVVTGTWRRKGVGRELLKKAVERARVLSVKRLEIQSQGQPTEGLTAFFRSCGFELAETGIYRMR